jgi:hypothetical protein
MEAAANVQRGIVRAIEAYAERTRKPMMDLGCLPTEYRKVAKTDLDYRGLGYSKLKVLLQTMRECGA